MVEDMVEDVEDVVEDVEDVVEDVVQDLVEDVAEPPGTAPSGSQAPPAAAGGRRAAGRVSRLLQVPVELRDAGMATAEYAIVTVAAAGFAGLLIAILRSDEVRELLLGIVRGALAV